jgi:hypothetical protein
LPPSPDFVQKADAGRGTGDLRCQVIGEIFGALTLDEEQIGQHYSDTSRHLGEDEHEAVYDELSHTLSTTLRWSKEIVPAVQSQ